MPAKRVPMRRIKDILRLKYAAGLSHEKIARAWCVSKGAVAKYVALAQAAGLSWAVAFTHDKRESNAQYTCVFPRRSIPRGRERRNQR